MNDRSGPASVITVDCNFHVPRFAAAYLLVGDGQAAFVDNNTVNAVPYLMAALDDNGLSPDDVRYIIITHLHLDHAGATGTLARLCPNAVVVGHPWAERHLVDPAKLVAAVKGVYGDDVFAKDYGHVEPVDAARIVAPADGETMELGGRTLTIMHTLGHAKHHICIHDSGSNGVFTGDSFGIALPAVQRGTRPLITCSAAPPHFDPDEARKTVKRVAETGAERVWLTHFGEVTQMDMAAESILDSIGAMESIVDDAVSEAVPEAELRGFCVARVREALVRQAKECGIDLTDDDWDIFKYDVSLNSGGTAALALARQNG